MDPERPQSPVEPNRVALIAIAALANGIGCFPYFLFVDFLIALPAVVFGSAVLAWFALRNRTTETTTEPSLGEWLLGGWSAVFAPSTGSLFALALFGLFYGSTELFIWLARYSGGALTANPETWGFWGSIWSIAVISATAATESLNTLFLQFYPREAGARSAFFSLLAQGKLIAFSALGALVVLGLMLWWLDLHGALFAVLLSILLFYTSLPLSLVGRERSDTAQVKIVDALAALLQDGGYRIVRTPRTGKAEIDPLLGPVDLLARTDERAFAVQVKAVASDAPVEWNEASALRTAAQLLSEENVTGNAARVPVEAVLMLVGGSIAQSLAAFSQRERIPVVHFETIEDATDNRSELARRLQAAGLVFPSPHAASSAAT